MMFEPFYGLTIDEVLSKSAGIRGRESHGSTLMVLRDSFQVEHYKASVSRSCCSWVEQQESEISCRSFLSSTNSKVVVKHVAFGR